MVSMSSHKPEGPLVATLIYDGLCTFEFGQTYELFGLPRPEFGSNWYRYETVAIEDGPLRAAGGLEIKAEKQLEALERADIIIIPGWRGIETPVPEDLIVALCKAHQRGARLASICSGAFVLAQAGLLNGRTATTHWRYAQALQSEFPAINVEEDRLYSETDRVFTSAGSAAGMDLALHIIRQDYGAQIANSVAKRLVAPPFREGTQTQFAEQPVPDQRESKRFASLFEELEKKRAYTMSVPEMAELMGMSQRTFIRKFSKVTGQAPAEWRRAKQLETAKHLLEAEETIDMEKLSHLSGFGSAATLRHHFRSKYGTTPTAYRRQFQTRQS
ncbi:transcriptional regulator FtrA [Pseudovibrio japonicus]|uniref:Transcriptional regulator FtrA n=1 Tax=Pseudovibrio japonicus TaxID=366534 RepID=A0ABQ3ERD4_9HYPH|nr:transcriptional regulator FtrA [Pseudovibrio japonicus]GHB46218.1 transcriptional regulator FtrA [Pseudovibrio japonicus]